MSIEQISKIFFWTAGAAMILAGVLVYRRAREVTAGAAVSWVSAPGVIITSGVDELARSYLMWGWLPTKATSWKPQAEYSYLAGERRGTRAFLTDHEFVTRKQTSDWLAANAPGAATTVWYDPRSPDESALNIGSPDLSSPIVLVVFGAICVLLGFASL